ncbi:MAG TPA: helix-turn-helix transcriptional regulator [Allosphingosinicella sp.]|nr:helix-turn-helix transcriptional regulator [Allosphingosinicella sp.]
MSEMRQRIESLSPRQFAILVCVARHMSSREIGQALGLSVSTVDSHVATALHKLGLASRREAALRMIDSGFTPSPQDADAMSRSGDFRHGGNSLSNLHELRTAEPPIHSKPSGAGRARPSGEDGDESRALAIDSAMAKVMVHHMLNGFYIIAFFAIMSAVALGANWIVIECERSSIDPFVLLVLKSASYMLVIVDAVGVVTVTGLLTHRFIRITMKADN